jgi:hypothetical protein
MYDWQVYDNWDRKTTRPPKEFTPTIYEFSSVAYFGTFTTRSKGLRLIQLLATLQAQDGQLEETRAEPHGTSRMVFFSILQHRGDSEKSSHADESLEYRMTCPHKSCSS